MAIERMFKQAWETVFLHQDVIKHGDTLNPFNRRLDQSGICPTITTRPDGFKTCVAVVEIIKE